MPQTINRGSATSFVLVEHLDAENPLGEGGFGSVSDCGNGTVVKRANQGQEEFLRLEIKILKKLDHSNIIRYIEGKPEEPQLIMECGGDSIAHWFKNKHQPKSFSWFFQPFQTQRVEIDLFKQLLKGVAYLEEKEIAHRDLKLENLTLTSDRVLKIIDFGLAEELEGVRDKEFLIAGTINYIPPEQHKQRGVKKLDLVKQDPWASGIIAIELFGNKRFNLSVRNSFATQLENRNFSTDIKGIKERKVQTAILRLLRRNPSARLGAKEALGLLEERRAMP